MWRALALVEGNWQQIEPIILEPQLPSSSGVLEAMQSRYSNDEYLLRYVRNEAESAQTSRDAIQFWAGDAGEPFAALDGSLAYYAIRREGDENPLPDTMAWHDATAVILRLTGAEDETLIEYTPSNDDQLRADRLYHKYGSSDHKLETILDWRGYFGARTAIIDGWHRLRKKTGTFVTRVRGRAGFLVGYVLRRLTRDQPTLRNDPTMSARLVEMCDRHWSTAQSYRDLSTRTMVQHDHAIVFVHGTMSCGIQCLKDLPDPTVPTYRYEHDTFLPIRENGQELFQLIRTRLDTKNLLLIGHSRGGLVARIAAEKLVQDGYPADPQVWTFGTPHNGTPLVNIGGQCLNLLWKLGEEISGGIPALSYMTKAYSYVLDSPVLPPGIEVMKDKSETLETLNDFTSSSRVRCWGSSFDIQRGNSGFGVDVEGVLMGAMGSSPHDLVVPLGSATGFGTPEPALGCSHSNYFQEQSVRTEIQEFAGQGFALPVTPPGGGVALLRDIVVVGPIRLRRKA